MNKEDQLREFNQQTLRDAFISINAGRIREVLIDIKKDSRLKGVCLNPEYDESPDYVCADRYEVSAGISLQKEVNLATVVKSADIYIASFGVIIPRDYPEDSEERKKLDPMIQALKEIFKRYKA